MGINKIINKHLAETDLEIHLYQQSIQTNPPKAEEKINGVGYHLIASTTSAQPEESHRARSKEPSSELAWSAIFDQLHSLNPVL